jgi:hypothetical protein
MLDILLVFSSQCLCFRVKCLILYDRKSFSFSVQCLYFRVWVVRSVSVPTAWSSQTPCNLIKYAEGQVYISLI